MINVDADPQNNTRIQRSWLPGGDRSVDVAERNMKLNLDFNASRGSFDGDAMKDYRRNLSQTKPYDIATSLPLERISWQPSSWA
jgi:hypothetical protein